MENFGCAISFFYFFEIGTIKEVIQVGKTQTIMDFETTRTFFV